MTMVLMIILAFFWTADNQRCLSVSRLVLPLTCAGEDFAADCPLSVKPWRYISFWTQSRMRGEGIISPSYYQSCIKAPSSGIPQQSTAQFPQQFYSDSCRRSSSSWTGPVWWLSSSVTEEWSPSRCISSFHFHQPTSFSTSSASCLHLSLSITTIINVCTFRTLSIVIDHPDHISWSSHTVFT